MSSSISFDRAWRSFAFGFVGLTLISCGSLTAGGVDGDGEVRVVVSGDATDPLNPLVQGMSRSVPARQEAEDPLEGQLRVDFELSLVALDGTIRRLTTDVVEVQVDLQGRQEFEVSTIPVPAGDYRELLIFFSEIQAEVEGGLEIDGVPYTGQVRVAIEDLDLLVSRAVTLSIREDLVSEVLVDLNSAAWLQELEPETGTISMEFFEALVSVRVINP